MEPKNASTQGQKNMSAADSHLYLTAKVEINPFAETTVSDETEIQSVDVQEQIKQQAKIALTEFLQTQSTRITTIDEELQMLDANLNLVDQLVQKNAFLMREVKYLMKL
ncbi:MAG: hypothetical protein ACK5P5_13415 [Pseudobdellovibrionaceae bacterium]